jgi:hypothetical protein
MVLLLGNSQKLSDLSEECRLCSTIGFALMIPIRRAHLELLLEWFFIYVQKNT